MPAEFLQTSWIFLQREIYVRDCTQNFCNHRGFDISKERYLNGIYAHDWTQNFCNHRGFDISKERYFNGIYAHDWTQNFCNHRGFDISKERYFNGIYVHISATIVDLISPKRDILTEFMFTVDAEFLQP